MNVENRTIFEGEAYFLISHLVIPDPFYDKGQSVYVPSRYASERQGCKNVVDSG